MNRNNSPGLGQWITVTLMVAVSLFLLVKLYQFAGLRVYYPTGLTIGGINVGQMTAEQATQELSLRYMDAPIRLYHGDDSFDIMPIEAEFTLDFDQMLSMADDQRTRQDFWSGFWGYLWGRPVEVAPVPLVATHSREALGTVLERIRSLTDLPAQPPQPVPGSMSFQYGTPGTETNIEASFADVESALYRPSNREARLVVEPKAPERPNINILARLLVNRLQVFEQDTGGLASVFIMDLDSGEEININSNEAISAIDLMKIPIVLETHRALVGLPTLSQEQLIADTLIINPENTSANQLLALISGEKDDAFAGAQIVTESMRRLGLVNTFVVAPYDTAKPNSVRVPETPANTAQVLRGNPSQSMQTTTEDIGTLLSMIYYCARGEGGALPAAYPDNDWQRICLDILDTMGQNKIGSLLEAGVPPDTPVAHRHGWVSDTNVDAGIVFSPGGNYVIVQALHKPSWLEWELSSPLMSDVSRAAYNYFNFDAPYLGEGQAANN